MQGLMLLFWLRVIVESSKCRVSDGPQSICEICWTSRRAVEPPFDVRLCVYYLPLVIRSVLIWDIHSISTCGEYRVLYSGCVQVIVVIQHLIEWLI